MAREAPSIRRVLALAAILLVPLVLPTAPAASFLMEDWQSGTDGWTISGMGLDCGWGGCSLRSDPPCCNIVQFAERAVDVPLATDKTIVAELLFYNNLTANSMHPSFEVQFDHGFARLSLNRDEQETIRLETLAGSQVFAHYSRFEWYKVQLLIRGDDVMATFSGGRFEPGATSIVLDLPGATRITGLRIANVLPDEWRVTPYYFDNIALYDTPTCFPFTPTLVVATPTAEHPLDPGFTLGLSGGHATCPTTWSLDFGDNTSTSGTGAPPASVAHTYTAAGTYTATLAVTQSGETRTATRTITALECNPLVATITSPFTQGPAPFDASLSTSTGSDLARCETTWRLDFGDGSPVLTGTGAAPVGVQHTYTTPGVYTARFEAVRGTESASASRILAAGPLEQTASGSFVAGVHPPGTSINPFQQRVDLLYPTDGSDTLSVRWSAAVPSDLDVYFARAGQRLAAPCTSEGTIGVEACPVPRGADSFVVAARFAVSAEWTAVVRYA